MSTLPNFSEAALMRAATAIALVVGSAFLALWSCEYLLPWSNGGCGGYGEYCIYAIPGTAEKLRVYERRSRWGDKRELFIGSARIPLPMSPTLALASLVSVAAALAGLSRRRTPKLLGFGSLATVFTLVVAHIHIRPGLEFPALLLLSLTTIVATVSWIASFRLYKQSVNDALVT